MIFVSFGKMQCVTFFDKINSENFLLFKSFAQKLGEREQYARTIDTSTVYSKIITKKVVGLQLRSCIHCIRDS